LHCGGVFQHGNAGSCQIKHALDILGDETKRDIKKVLTQIFSACLRA
jgi:hypothetical protein